MLRGMKLKPLHLAGPGVPELAGELHRICTGECRGAIHDVADLLNRPYTTIYSQITGEPATLPLDTLKAIHFSTRARRLDRVVLWPGLRATVDTTNTAPPTLCVDKEGGDVSIAAAALHARLRAATADGVLDEDEAIDTLALVEKARRELDDIESLILTVRKQGGRTDGGSNGV